MWQWIGQNSEALNFVVSAGLLVIWASYLQLFLYGYWRQRRCKILINMGGDSTLAARCLLSNMSAEPIYVLTLVATVRTGEEQWSKTVTDYEWSDEDQPPRDSARLTRQGPLQAGEYRDLGSFAELIEGARHAHGEQEPLDRLQKEHRPFEIELTAVAIYGSEDLPVGARRCFQLSQDGKEVIRPVASDTHQVRGRRARRDLHKHLGDYL